MIEALGYLGGVILLIAAGLLTALMLLAIGALGALNILPSAISEWFPGELAAPLVLFAFGGLLVAAAIYTAQQRRIKPDTPARTHDYAVGTPRVAAPAAVVTSIAVTVAVLILA